MVATEAFTTRARSIKHQPYHTEITPAKTQASKARPAKILTPLIHIASTTASYGNHTRKEAASKTATPARRPREIPHGFRRGKSPVRSDRNECRRAQGKVLSPRGGGGGRREPRGRGEEGRRGRRRK